MTMFAIGFVFITIFTLLMGIIAMVFISMDSAAFDDVSPPIVDSSQNVYPTVRRLNTNTIETIDEGGNIQHWSRIHPR